jgi:glucose/arabinose dehydrogenase
MHLKSMRRLGVLAALALAGAAHTVSAQDAPAPPAPAPAAAAAFPRTAPLGAGPWDYDTKAGKVHVEVLARRLDRPWSAGCG